MKIDHIVKERALELRDERIKERERISLLQWIIEQRKTRSDKEIIEELIKQNNRELFGIEEL